MGSDHNCPSEQFYNFAYSSFVKIADGKLPIRQFGLEGLQKPIIPIAPDTINDKKVINEIQKLRQTLSAKTDPKLIAMIDIQNDFVIGSLKIEGAEKIFPKLEELMAHTGYDAVLLTVDNHPKDHVSFASCHPHTEPFIGSYIAEGNGQKPQTAWPDHCVQGSQGVEIHPVLIEILSHYLNKNVPIFLFPKGEGTSEAYSAGENVAGERLPYCDFLNIVSCDKRITVDHVGLAADYCVAATAKSAAKIENIHSRVIKEATMAIQGQHGMQSGSYLSSKQIQELYDQSNVTPI